LIYLRFMPENDLIEVQINHQVMAQLGKL
jgi:hypothetical protein